MGVRAKYALGVLCVACLAVAGVASAAGSFHTSVTIHFRATQGNEVVFHGAVDSSQAACIPNREVVVKRMRPGTDKPIGDDKTRSDGRWRVAVLSDQIRSGEYYAHVRK